MAASPATGRSSVTPLLLHSSASGPGVARSRTPAVSSAPAGPVQPALTRPPEGDQKLQRPAGATGKHPSEDRAGGSEFDKATCLAVKSVRAFIQGSWSWPVGEELTRLSWEVGNKEGQGQRGQVGCPEEQQALEAPRSATELPSQQQSVAESPSQQRGRPPSSGGARVTHRLAGQASSHLPPVSSGRC